jgi:hypothetical protein
MHPFPDRIDKVHGIDPASPALPDCMIHPAGFHRVIFIIRFHVTPITIGAAITVIPVLLRFFATVQFLAKPV